MLLNEHIKRHDPNIPPLCRLIEGCFVLHTKFRGQSILSLCAIRMITLP